MSFHTLRRTTAGGFAIAAAVFGCCGLALAQAQAPRPSNQPATAPAANPAAPAATNPGATPAPGGAAGGTEKPQDALTVESLIGDAVSLSNQQYPEVDSAIQRFRNGDAPGAREYLVMAKQKYPKLPPVDLLMAKMWVFFRSGDQARQQLEAAVTNNPTDPEAYLLLAD